MAQGWGICPSNGSYMWGIWTAFWTLGRGIWPLKIKKIQMPGGGMLMLQIDRCITLSNQIGHPQIRVNCVMWSTSHSATLERRRAIKKCMGIPTIAKYQRICHEIMGRPQQEFGSLMVALTAWNQQQEHKRPPFYRQDMFILNFLANKYSDMLRLLKSSYVYL